MARLPWLAAGILLIVLQPGCGKVEDPDREAKQAKPKYEQRKWLTNDEFLAKAAKEGEIAIIVKLRMKFTPEGRLADQKRIIAQRREIARLQLDLLKALAPYKVSRVKRFKHAPSLALTVNFEALKALLAQSKLFTLVELDLLRRLHLTDSAPLVGARAAMGLGFGGGGLAVAILDTGVDKNHDFLVNKVVGEACFSDNLCPNGTSEEFGSGTGMHCSGVSACDHGTHVAGIAAGWGGVAVHAFVVAIKVFNKVDTATCTDLGLSRPCLLTSDSNYSAALDWLHGHTYNMLGVPTSLPAFSLAAANLSLGGGEFTSSTECDQSTVKDHIDNLRSIGTATVISAGNDSFTNALSFPACISTAISVGSTTKGNAISSFSNRANFMSLWAPGSSITSSIPGGGFAAKSGTSMAAPHVTAAFAILKDASPNFLGFGVVDEILSALQSTGQSISGSPSTAARRIKIDSALDAL